MSPNKPTADDAASTARPQDMYEKGAPDARAAESADQQAAHGTGRKEIGGSGDNGVHTPHVTVNDRDAPLQDDRDGGGDVAALPANASGSEKKGAVGSLNHGSAYEGRREEDKDQPPSEG